ASGMPDGREFVAALLAYQYIRAQRLDLEALQHPASALNQPRGIDNHELSLGGFHHLPGAQHQGEEMDEWVNVADEVHGVTGRMGQIRRGIEVCERDGCRRAYILLADVRVHKRH